uniref:Uncharacterized protein n=1 Tax=Lactuca sativa TaxID=4236 RepID=A0A9R1UV64_LACSA|nr:hypothetical protein LSAT_V11C800420890 [Lactuca sativa]
MRMKMMIMKTPQLRYKIYQAHLDNPLLRYNHYMLRFMIDKKSLLPMTLLRQLHNLILVCIKRYYNQMQMLLNMELLDKVSKSITIYGMYLTRPGMVHLGCMAPCNWNL